MPASEPTGETMRFALLHRLIEVLGEEEGRTLMASLPPVLWTHLATKDDVKASEERLRTDFNGQFALVNAEFARVNAEFARVHVRIDGLEDKVDAGFESLRSEITKGKGETALMLARQTRAMVAILIGFALSVWIPMLFVGLS